MNQLLQYGLYYSDIAFIILCGFATYKSYTSKNWSVLTISVLLMISGAVRHFSTSVYSTYPKDVKIEFWYQTFIYINFSVLFLSIAIHAVLLWHTSRVVRLIYGLLTLNACCYGFMHFQRNVFNINQHNWTWDVYTMTVVPVNYAIAGLLIYASLKIGSARPETQFLGTGYTTHGCVVISTC